MQPIAGLTCKCYSRSSGLQQDSGVRLRVHASRSGQLSAVFRDLGWLPSFAGCASIPSDFLPSEKEGRGKIQTSSAACAGELGLRADLVRVFVELNPYHHAYTPYHVYDYD